MSAGRGRSLWTDALRRLWLNKAAVLSMAYLALMTALCVIGPYFTGHDFSSVYQTYVRVPPSIAPYPQAEAIEAELSEALKRARVEVKSWERKDGRVFVTVAADKPVDERTTRYLDRSDAFDAAKIEEKSADGLTLTAPTSWQGAPVLRFCFVNPLTTIEDVRGIIDSLR